MAVSKPKSSRDRYINVTTGVPKRIRNETRVDSEETVEDADSLKRKREQFGSWKAGQGPVVRQGDPRKKR
jgi:hypothetical protein